MFRLFVSGHVTIIKREKMTSTFRTTTQTKINSVTSGSQVPVSVNLFRLVCCEIISNKLCANSKKSVSNKIRANKCGTQYSEVQYRAVIAMLMF